MPSPTVNLDENWGGGAVIALDPNSTDARGLIIIGTDSGNDGKPGAVASLLFGTAYTRYPYAWLNCATFRGSSVPISYQVKMDAIYITMLETPWHGPFYYNIYYYVLPSN